MKLGYTHYFFILTAFFTVACTQQKSVEHEEGISEDGLFKVAYLDSASNQIFTSSETIIENSPENAYGFEKGDIVLYPDSVYEQRIPTITTDFDLIYNEQVKDYIEIYAYRKKDLTERMLGKSILYFPFIEEYLSQNQLPNDLKLLPMIESALRPEAESVKSASGLWQIRYETGKALGLKINSYVDERRDPYASSVAGVKYLAKLYDLYHDWWLAIAAYNCGMGNMNKAIIKAGGSRDYWEVSNFLPKETRDYVPAFIAMTYLFHYREEHNLRPNQLDLAFNSVDTIMVYQQASLKRIAKKIDMPLSTLQFLNPKFLTNTIPSSSQGISLVLPINKVALFENKCKDLLYHREKPENTLLTARVLKSKQPVVPDAGNMVEIIHTIKPGNTLDEISRKYHCSVQQLMDWNALHDPLLQIGYDLKVYVPESNTLEASTSGSDVMLVSSVDGK